jgi:hypothetical protein
MGTFRSRTLAVVAVGIAGAVAAPVATGAQASPQFRPSGVRALPSPAALVPNALDDEGDEFLPSDAPPSLCTTRFARGNPFSLAGDTDAIVDDHVNTNAGSNAACVAPQNETTIAVNPTDPENIAMGANDYRVCCDVQGFNDSNGGAYASFDGGRSWRNVIVPGLTAQTGGRGFFHTLDAAGDPSMAFGPDGTLYFANLAFGRVNNNDAIAVNVSHDGGRTWSRPHLVRKDRALRIVNDKPWIGVDPVSGDLVVTWTRFDFGTTGADFSAPIVIARSSDGGVHWTGFRRVAPRFPVAQSSIPRFSSDGTLYVAYKALSPATSFTTDAMVVARSTNGGRSFTNREVGRVFDDVNCYPIKEGSFTLTNELFRVTSFPSFQVDPATGGLALVWADDQGAGTCGTSADQWRGVTSNQVKLVTSSDGVHFSAPRRLTHDRPDKVFPSVALRDGTVVVTYYTRRYSPTAPRCLRPGATPPPVGVCLDYAARTSTDGFASERRLTGQSSNPWVQFAGTFIGDYTETAIGPDGLAHASWTDFRGNPALRDERLRRPNEDAYTEAFQP